MFKKIIRKILANLGFKLININFPEVRFENFNNLTQVYEEKLNNIIGAKLIEDDEIRPKLLGRLLGTQPSEAYYIIEALAKTKTIEGDICEFGVAQGCTSTLMANEIKEQDKNLHLFDSFEGLPKPSSKDQLKDDIFSLGSINAYTGTMSFSETMVVSKLKELSFPEKRYIIHKGFIEGLIQKDKKMPKKVSFAYIDFDLYEPITIALNFLDKVTENGAIIIVDDYDYFSTGSKIAVDEFVKGKNMNRKIYDIEIPDSIYGHFAILTKELN